MSRLLLILLASLLVSCSSYDEEYYRQHPALALDAYKSCPEVKPRGLSCEELGALAKEIRTLAFAQQVNQQKFGLDIVDLQEKLAKATDANQKGALDKQLTTRLAIVAWLGSPES